MWHTSALGVASATWFIFLKPSYSSFENKIRKIQIVTVTVHSLWSNACIITLCLGLKKSVLVDEARAVDEASGGQVTVDMSSISPVGLQRFINPE